jgi:hypothetical protein
MIFATAASPKCCCLRPALKLDHIMLNSLHANAECGQRHTQAAWLPAQRSPMVSVALIPPVPLPAGDVPSLIPEAGGQR